MFTTVPAKKRRFSKGYYENGYWFSTQQTKENESFIKVQRYKQKAIDTVFPDFWEKYEHSLNMICAQLKAELEEKLYELIIERAYTNGGNTVNNDYWYENGHRPTFEFAHAWEVEVYVSSSGALHFDPVYHWEDMSVDVAPRNKGDNNLSHYSLHAGTFGNARGKDMRQALADILNVPQTAMYYTSIKVRKGRWYEAFMSYCRSEGVSRFKQLCAEYGIV